MWERIPNRRVLLRKLRNVIHTLLPIVGVVVIMGTVLYIRSLQGQVTLVLVGLLCIEFGVWKLAHGFFPDDRQYNALRFEGEQFIGLIRQLNTAALSLKEDSCPTNQQAFQEIQQAMHQSVERMAEVAGKTNTELICEQECST